MSNQSEPDSLRTIYMSEDDRATVQLQTRSATVIVIKILQDFVAGKLVVEPPKPHKTSAVIPDQLWMDASAKAKAQGLSMRKVIAAGVARLRRR